MSNVYHQIKDALVRALKTALPDMDVTSERLAKTDYGGSSDITDYIYIGLTPVSRETVSAYHTRHSVVIDLAVHTASEHNADYWALADTIDYSLRPVIRWDDRAITVPSVDYKIVDRILHCTFTLAFMVSCEEPEQYPLAETLEADIITPQGRVTSGIT
nr:MAG TPA: hypothetical protein [Caudoviricetes sp.]